MSGPTPTSTSSFNHVVSHDCNNLTSYSKNSYSARPPSFSGDVEQFS